MSKILTLEDIKKKSRDAQSEVVELKTWGGSVRICSMTPAAGDAYNKASKGGFPLSGQVPVVFSCVLEPAFGSEKQVSKMDWKLVNEAFLAIVAHGSEDVDEAEKNSETMDD